MGVADRGADVLVAEEFLDFPQFRHLAITAPQGFSCEGGQDAAEAPPGEPRDKYSFKLSGEARRSNSSIVLRRI